MGRSANWRWIYPSGSFGQNALRSIAGSSAKQPSIVLFMFKHCFHYDFTIGFVCGSWVRLRKASLSVGFVWLIRNRAAPTGSSANWRWIHPSGSFGQNRRAAARPSRLFAHTEDCAGSLLAGPSIARSINSARVDASAWESAEAERYEAKPITLRVSMFLVCSIDNLRLCQALCSRSRPANPRQLDHSARRRTPLSAAPKKQPRAPRHSRWRMDASSS